MSGISETDVAVVGAGPVGLFAVFECGMLGLSAHVIDTLDAVGGQLAALYPEKPIYDIPGYPMIEARTLVAELAAQAAPFRPVYHLGQQAVALRRLDDGRWELKTDAGTTIRAHAILIAAGVGAFGPHRPPLDGIEAFEGRSVFYLVTNRERFRGKRVVIAGGGDSAVDWALSLAEIASHVMLVHRRGKFRAAPESLARLDRLAAAGAIEKVVPYQLAGLEGDPATGLEAVLVRDLDGATRRLEADYLLPFFGLSMQLGPILDWGLGLDGHHISIEPATAVTNVASIYAVGDIATYPKKLKLILTGFAEAAQAAHAIRALVHPDETLHFEYSTTKGVPGL